VTRSAVAPDPELSAVQARYCSNLHEVRPGVFVRCGSHRASVCPSCSSLYRGDIAAIARSGVYDGEGRPVPGYRYFFITLSAPSFGAIHRVPKDGDRQRRRCRCGKTHSTTDTHLRGIPVDIRGYDYEAHIGWHIGLGRLWNSTVSAMRDLVPDLEFFAVRELQARMALHVHVIVRIPRGHLLTAADLGDAARTATARHPVTGDVVRWGQHGHEDSEIGHARELDPRAVDGVDVLPSESAAVARTIRYISKALAYSMKDLDPFAKDGGEQSASPERREFVGHLRTVARCYVACPQCWDVPGACMNKAHTNLGFSGHIVSVSRPGSGRRGWSFSGLTRAKLRARRRTWMECRSPELLRVGASTDAVEMWVWIKRRLRRRGPPSLV